MSVKLLSLKGCLPGIKKGLASLMVLQLLVGAPLSALVEDRHERRNPARDTRTPIKHVIIIIGENRTFDHIFARLCPATERKSPTCFPQSGYFTQQSIRAVEQPCYWRHV